MQDDCALSKQYKSGIIERKIVFSKVMELNTI